MLGASYLTRSFGIAFEPTYHLSGNTKSLWDRQVVSETQAKREQIIKMNKRFVRQNVNVEAFQRNMASREIYVHVHVR
jgi:hypothetical protein